MVGQVYAEGYGCPSNNYDLEIILSKFEDYGYTIVEDFVKADVIVVNTCAVKKRTEDRILSRLKFFEKMSKSVVVAGCLPVVNFEGVVKAIPSYVALLSPFSVHRINEVLNNKCQVHGENLLYGVRRIKVDVNIGKSRSVIKPIPISEGCFGDCSFCCARFARGRLLSYPIDSIVDSIRVNVTRGVKEFWVTGQDVGAYGRDKGWNLLDLLDKISSLEGDFVIRLGMINPEWCLEKLDDLIITVQNPKFFKFLHLPLQSGNDEVLFSMRRKYTAQDFIMIVKELRKKCPDITLWTDIICGYPIETEEGFDDTLNILKEVKFDVVNVSRFSSRPGTLAKQLKPIPSEYVKERSRRASQLWKEIALSRNISWRGWSGNILVDEKGKDGTWIGRTYSYKPVAFESHENLLGEKIFVKIVDVRPTHLIGKLIS